MRVKLPVNGERCRLGGPRGSGVVPGLETIGSIAALLITGGVLGALVQAYLDRKLRVTEWKQGLRVRILSPR